MQGIIVLSVVIAYEVVRRVGQRREAAAIAARSTTARPEPPASDRRADPAGAPA